MAQPGGGNGTGARFAKVAGRLGIFRKTRTMSPLVTAVGLALLFVLPLLPGGNSWVFQYSIYFVWMMLAQSWNLVGGYAGLINLGLVGFFAVGAVITSIVLYLGLPLVVALVGAGLGGMVLALLMTPTFRLRSDYFAIGTLVIPSILKPIVTFFAGKSSFDLPIYFALASSDLYYIGLVGTTATIFGIYLLMRSRTGMALRAIGDDELVSASLGVNVLFSKMTALIVSGLIASVAGAYYILILSVVNSTVFANLTFSLFPIFMVIIGGIGTFEGPIVGTLIFTVASYGTSVYFQGSGVDLLLFALLVMVVAVTMPKGIIPSLARLLRRVSGR